MDKPLSEVIQCGERRTKQCRLRKRDERGERREKGEEEKERICTL